MSDKKPSEQIEDIAAGRLARQYPSHVGGFLNVEPTVSDVIAFLDEQQLRAPRVAPPPPVAPPSVPDDSAPTKLCPRFGTADHGASDCVLCRGTGRVPDDSAPPEPLPDVLPVGTMVTNVFTSEDEPLARGAKRSGALYEIQGESGRKLYFAPSSVNWSHCRRTHQPQTAPPAIERVEGMVSAAASLAGALPIDHDDERIVDGLVARATEGREVRRMPPVPRGADGDDEATADRIMGLFEVNAPSKVRPDIVVLLRAARAEGYEQGKAELGAMTKERDELKTRLTVELARTLIHEPGQLQDDIARLREIVDYERRKRNELLRDYVEQREKPRQLENAQPAETKAAESGGKEAHNPGRFACPVHSSSGIGPRCPVCQDETEKETERADFADLLRRSSLGSPEEPTDAQIAAVLARADELAAETKAEIGNAWNDGYATGLEHGKRAGGGAKGGG
jgi:hypothetical protein